MQEGTEARTIEEAMALKHIASYKALAARVECSERSLRGWLHGERLPSAYYMGKLSTVLGVDARRLFQQREADMDKMPRRQFLSGMIALPLALSIREGIGNVSDPTIDALDAMTWQYRMLQRNGVKGIDAGIRGHIFAIQTTLESTIEDRKRRELWRILSQAQLLARLNITDPQELAKAKTWNEAAIASAQHSGDVALLGATLGHLAHLYMMWHNDTATAFELIASAHEHAGKHVGLHGWLFLITTATAAKAGDKRLCEVSIIRARSAVEDAKKISDPFFTDFSPVSVDIFGGHCLLDIEKPTKAYQLLTAINLKEIAENRQASTLYDISRAYTATGELEAAQVYALQAIDKAVETNRLYIVPRFLTLAKGIQQQDSHEPHARTIAEYAQNAMHSQWRV